MGELARFDLGDPDRDFGDRDYHQGSIEIEGATMGNYGNDTANAIDEQVQASKRAQGDGPSLREAERQFQLAREAMDRASKQLQDAQRPAVPADPAATAGLRLLRNIANRDEQAGRYAVGLVKALTPEQLTAIKTRLTNVPSHSARPW